MELGAVKVEARARVRTEICMRISLNVDIEPVNFQLSLRGARGSNWLAELYEWLSECARAD